MPKSAILLILDGWGHNPDRNYNAIAQAHTPNYDSLIANHLHTLLDASGVAVGLPEGQMGNSEVGHVTIGSGRIIYQDLPRIDKAISNGEFASNAAFNSIVTKLEKKDNVCHVLGLASDGGVHSHINHIITTCKLLKDKGVKYQLHIFTDGRDTAPKSANKFIQQILKEGLEISTIVGRYYAMDRDNRWERTELAYNAIFNREGSLFTNPTEAIEKSYADNITDEFIVPQVKAGSSGVVDGDGLIMVNFRADRVRQLLTSITEDSFNNFIRKKIKFSVLVGMAEYSSQLNKQLLTMFPKQEIHNTIGEVVAKSGGEQLRIAETEKYAHVTFFLNGGREEVFQGEERILVPSPKIATYDLQPQMSIKLVTEKLVKAINDKRYLFICANFANADMVGHSGDLAATIKAIEAIDIALGQIMEAAKNASTDLFITADHGNAEQMLDLASNIPLTSHTLSKVPFIYYGTNPFKLRAGGLSDIAPTVLRAMNLDVPQQMSGTNLCE